MLFWWCTYRTDNNTDCFLTKINLLFHYGALALSNQNLVFTLPAQIIVQSTRGRYLYLRLGDMYFPHPLANMKTLLNLTVKDS